MSDKELRRSVVEELQFDPRIDSSKVSVQAENGVVTLIGHVSNFAEKLAAQDAARRVRGVSALADELEVRSPYGKKTADDEIASRALKILEWYDLLPANPLQVTVQNGLIFLTGEVMWQFQKRAAEHAVGKLSGIVGVVNNITIKPTISPADIKQKIEDALARHANVEAQRIQVTVQDGSKISLEGRVDSWEERNAVDNAAWSVAGVQSVDNRLTTAR